MRAKTGEFEEHARIVEHFHRQIQFTAVQVIGKRQAQAGNQDFFMFNRDNFMPQNGIFPKGSRIDPKLRLDLVFSPRIRGIQFRLRQKN